MGGFDIFKTIINENGVWSEPENLGYPVNTPDDDIFFQLSTDGKTGYYSSSREGGYGNTDIYTIHFPDERMDLSVYKGSVTDTTGKPLLAQITLTDTKTDDMEGVYTTNALTGKFIMILSPGKEYTMEIESEGYNLMNDKVHAEVEQKAHLLKLHPAVK